MAKSDAKTGKGEGSGSSDNEVRDDPIRLDKRSLATEEPEAESAPTEVAGTQEVGVEFAGAAGAEELSDLISQTGGDEGNSELDALDPSMTRKGRGDYDDLTDDSSADDGIVSFEERMNQGSRPDGLFEDFGSGSGDDDDASSKSMYGGGGGNPSSQSTVGGGGGDSSQSAYGGGGGGGDDQSHTLAGGGMGNMNSPQNPIVNPITGEGATEPAGGFLDYVETKTGSDESLDPGGGATGSGRSVADGETHRDIRPDGTTFTMDGDRPVAVTRHNDEAGITVTHTNEGTTVTDQNNGTITFLNDKDGSTVTRNLNTGKVIDETPPLKDPGPDAPYRATLEEKASDPLFQQYQQSKNAGGGGDGATDPSEVDDGVVLEGALTQEQINEEAVGMFGQPPPGEDFAGEHRTGTPDSPLGERIQPGHDQDLVVEQGRTENPANAVPDTDPVAGMPADDPESDTSDGGESLLPNYDILGPVDDPAAEVPDYIDVADVP